MPQKKSPEELGRCAGETLRAGEFVRWPGWVRASNFGEPPQELRSSLFSEPKGQHGFFGCFRRFPSSECARKKRLKKDSSVGNSKCCWTPSNDYSSWSNYYWPNSITEIFFINNIIERNQNIVESRFNTPNNLCAKSWSIEKWSNWN